LKRILAAFIVGWIGLTIACAGAWAQATAQISGTVRDQSGAVLPGVEVTATQTETGVMRMTVTNETGTYQLQNLATGPYRLEASLPGFRTFVQTGIVLQVNANPVINPVLEVGQITDQIEVQANVAQVETRTTAVGSVIENERILELPLNGRNVTDLITLSGASV
jgi:Carboxypeptidase regulatory-like domain